MHAFLVGCKDGDATVRASCLSNLAEVCKVLGIGAHPYLEEILLCVESILEGDKEVEVQRGALFVFFMLLDGLGVEAFQLIPHKIATIHSKLQRYVDDPDPVTQYHALTALDLLEEVVRQYMFGDAPPRSILHVMDDPAPVARIAQGGAMIEVLGSDDEGDHR